MILDRIIPAVAGPAARRHRRDRGGADRHEPRRSRRGSRTPAQPGPGPHAGGAPARARPDRSGAGSAASCPGEFRAHDLGGGTELAQVRPYEPGDDVRRIDWNVTARTTIPHVRVHVPERALTTWLLLDVSPSMTFGTADRRKADVAEGVALAIGHLSRPSAATGSAIADFGGRRDRAACPADRAVAGPARAARSRPPRRARRPTAAPVGAVIARGAPSGSSPAAAPRGGLVVLVSDFRGPRDWLRAAGAPSPPRHQRPRRRDPRPARGRPARRRRARRSSTPRPAARSASTPRRATLRDRFAEAAAARARRRSPRELRRLGVGHVVLSTSGELAAVARRASSASGESRHDLRLARAPARPPARARSRWSLYLLVQRRRARYVVRFTNVDLLVEPRAARRPPGAATCRRPSTSPRSRALAIALARPSMVVAVPREEATIILTMDVSGSMMATDVSPTRLAAAKQAASDFVDQLPAELQGRARRVLDGRARVVVPPTTDRAQHPRRRSTTCRPTAAPRWATRSRCRSRPPASTRSTRPAGPGPSATPAPSASIRRRRRRPSGSVGARPTRRSRRSSRPCCCPTARTRPAPSSRSTPRQQAAARRRARLHDRARHAGRHGRRCRTRRPGRCARSTCRRTPRRSPPIAETTGGRFFEAPTAEDLAQIYESLGSKVGYTQRGAGGHAVVRRGGPAARPRRRGPGGALVQPLPLIHHARPAS